VGVPAQGGEWVIVKGKIMVMEIVKDIQIKESAKSLKHQLIKIFNIFSFIHYFRHYFRHYFGD
jgi:hypothetical protein